MKPKGKMENRRENVQQWFRLSKKKNPASAAYFFSLTEKKKKKKRKKKNLQRTEKKH